MLKCGEAPLFCSPGIVRKSHLSPFTAAGGREYITAASLQSAVMPLTHQSEANVRGDAQDPSQTMACLESAASPLEILKALPLRVSFIYLFIFSV